MNERIALYGLSRPELVDLVRRLGMPRYRADQVWHWLYVGLVERFDAMTTLSVDDRERLAQVADLGRSTRLDSVPSPDGSTVKSLHGLADGLTVESVVMHYADPADAPGDEDVDGAGAGPGAGARDGGDGGAGRHTLCLSTQVGCAMGCVFCATGQMGLLRDLSRAECVEQVVLAARDLARQGKRLTNIVFMGMGEPLANWPATWGTVETVTDPLGFGLSPRRLTISTVGIVPGILRLAESRIPVRLAVSLHAPDDALRSRLVAVNRTYPLADILAACRTYQRSGGRRITFEYVLIEGQNDAVEQAAALARLVRGIVCHFNLIPYNPIAGSPVPMRPSPPEAASRFAETLRAAGLPTTLRMRRGISIAAGCGQLRARHAAGRLGRTIPLAPGAADPAAARTATAQAAGAGSARR